MQPSICSFAFALAFASSVGIVMAIRMLSACVGMRPETSSPSSMEPVVGPLPALHQSRQECRKSVRWADTRSYELAIRGSGPSFQRDTRAAGGQHTRYLDDRTNCLRWEWSPSCSTADPMRSGQPKRPNKEGFSGAKPVSCALLTPSVPNRWLVNARILFFVRVVLLSSIPSSDCHQGLSRSLGGCHRC